MRMKALFTVLGLAALLSACGLFREAALYEQEADDAKTPNIAGFYALQVYRDQMSDEVWYTPSPKALKVQAETAQKAEGLQSISIEWNKQADPQTWLGLGFGWNGWTGKNFEAITQQAALSFWVKSKEGQSAGLPWAVGFEDFNGAQAWTGVTSGFIQGGIVKDEWTEVKIPLSAFPFEARDVDVTIIKQLIVQFESSGKVWVDNIRLVPYQSRGRQTQMISPLENIVLDGQPGEQEWLVQAFEIPFAKVWLSWDDMHLYLAAQVEDASPLINTRSDKDIWNGDALELAFSTVSGTNPQRKVFYPTDLHLGISMSEAPLVFDWTKKKAIAGAKVVTRKTGTGYSAEIAIPWKALGTSAFEPNQTYGCEVAVDIANEASERTLQSRWNSSEQEGFHNDPSRWGQIIYRISK